jgi:hypothetical protein
MPIKTCEICDKSFKTRLNIIRTCGIVCRNKLVAAEKEAAHVRSKNCVICGAPFTLSGHVWNRVTCSSKCAYKLRGNKQSKRVKKICQTCGIDYEVKRCESSTSNYCSYRCMYSRNTARTLRNCVVCGIEFKSPPSQLHVLTCSPKCGYEIRENNDQRILFKCAFCNEFFLESPSIASKRIFCSAKCRFSSETTKQKMSYRILGDKNPFWKGGTTRWVVSVSGLRYARSSSAIENERSVRRNRAVKEATPTWVNMEEVLEFYFYAQALTKHHGRPYHVHHIVPLQSSLVCGFHCESNLTVITGLENLQISNKWWPDMP